MEKLRRIRLAVKVDDTLYEITFRELIIVPIYLIYFRLFRYNKSYIGYCYWCSCSENPVTPLSKKEYAKFDFWKKELSYDIYKEKCKKKV